MQGFLLACHLSTRAPALYSRSPAKVSSTGGHIQKFCDSIQAIRDKVFGKEHTAQLRHGEESNKRLTQTWVPAETEIDDEDDEVALPRAQQYAID